MNLSTEKKIMDLENRFIVAKGEGEGEGEGRTGNLGLIDAQHCLRTGYAMRSCYIALGTIVTYDGA